LKELLAPIRKAGPQRGHVFIADAVTCEAPVGVAIEDGEQVGEDPPVKSGVRLFGELTESFSAVSSGRHGGIDVEEVARFCSGEQRRHFAGDNVIRV
jgi:hypothetical protein